MRFKDYELVRIISLAERVDRRREMAGQLGHAGLKLGGHVGFFDAYRPAGAGRFINRGAHGCFLSHLEVLRQARGRSVLILEDDCDFAPRAFEYAIPECDIFYGGFLEATDPGDPARGGIVGAHCMGFSGRAAALAAAYLEGLLDPSFPADAQAATEAAFDPSVRPPVDGAYIWFRRAHPELTVRFASGLTKQRSSRSDITPGRLDTIPFVAGMVQTLRIMRRELLGGARAAQG